MNKQENKRNIFQNFRVSQCFIFLEANVSKKKGSMESNVKGNKYNKMSKTDKI